MNKLFKRITTTAMAAIITSSALATYANAAYEEKPFHTIYVNSQSYIPSEVNYGATFSLVASNDRYYAKLTNISRMANASVTITSPSHSMSKTVVFTQTEIPISWEITTDSRKNVTYNAKGYTSVYGTMSADGIVWR